MFVKSVNDCDPLIANDGCRVFELLHPANDPIALSYSFAIAEVKPGESSYRHRLEQSEVYYLLAGGGRMHIDDEEREVTVGDAVYIPAQAEQWIENTQPTVLRFVAIVAPPWRADQDHRL